MGRFDVKYSRTLADKAKYGKGSFLTITSEEFNSFNSTALGIGNVSQSGKYVQALAAVYDLQGFTQFCNQIDSHLVIPEFLQRFVDWLFLTLAESAKEGEKNLKVTLWAPLPFFAKFLGDGVLLLWDTEMLGDDKIALQNVIKRLYGAGAAYRDKFVPRIRKHVTNPPPVLRCGIARGQIIPIGDGYDYVGSCINVASRIQKLSDLSFAISRRGLDVTDSHDPFLKGLLLKRVALRGIGKDELIYVVPEEFIALHAKEKKQFCAP